MQKHLVLESDRPRTSIREVYLLWKPLARNDFSQFGLTGEWYRQPLELKKILLVQVLPGLSALHDCGWIHRDLKPQNLSVVELSQTPFAVIIDEGAAVRQKQGGHIPRIGCFGSTGFLAPELESNTHVSSYGKEIDIWSMGAVAYYLFVSGRIPWSMRFNMFVKERNAIDPTLSVFREVQAGLLSHPPQTLKHLIGQMLEEDPRNRPTMREILGHDVLRSVRETIDAAIDAEGKVGQKRNWVAN